MHPILRRKGETMGRPQATDEKRFENFLEKVRKTKSCWIWTGTKSSTGYGMFFNGDKCVKAHRYSYEKQNHVPLKKDQLILHSCNNRLCVNPGHLRIGTHKENVQDAIKAMTFPVCQKNSHAKLTPMQVRQIRRLYVPWKFGCLKLSRMFNVSKRNITRIVSGESWRHSNYVAA